MFLVSVVVDPAGSVIAHVQAPQLLTHRPKLAARLLQPGLQLGRAGGRRLPHFAPHELIRLARGLGRSRSPNV
eukprot:scaffold42611_cov64-Phaeocystis_antarctica.AAC.4